MTELGKLLPSDRSSKKNKKKSKEENTTPVLSDTETEKLRKDIKKINEKISSLEADWDFDKKKAEELYSKKIEIITQEIRQKQIEERAQMKKMQEEKGEEKVEEVEEDDDDDDGGLFGGLMMDDEEGAASTLTTTSIQWNIVDLAVPKSWMGRYPKDLLLDYCSKQKLGKQSFSSNTVSASIWRSSLKVIKDGYSRIPLLFELPQEIGTSNRHDAEQLMALHALFELDSNSSVYKVLPNVYKDLWTTWLEEKVRLLSIEKTGRDLLIYFLEIKRKCT